MKRILKSQPVFNSAMKQVIAILLIVLPRLRPPKERNNSIACLNGFGGHAEST